jgi:hypothetical protein
MTMEYLERPISKILPNVRLGSCQSCFCIF